MSEPTVRPAVKGVVVRAGRVLLLHHWYRNADYFELPGGGQHHGESLGAALRREVLEETGVEVVPGRLLWVRDYIAANHQFAEQEGQRHQIELVYECYPTDRPSIEPKVPDTFQIGTVWVPPGEITALPLYPETYKPWIERHLQGRNEGVAYLGDVN